MVKIRVIVFGTVTLCSDVVGYHRFTTRRYNPEDHDLEDVYLFTR